MTPDHLLARVPFRILGTDVIVGCSAGIRSGPRRPGDRRDHAQRRRRDVPGQGERQAPRRGVRPRMHSAIVERHALTADLGQSLSRGDLTVALPADRLARQRADRRCGGARALEPPDSRTDRSDRVRPAGRGERHDPRPRAVRAPDRGPAGRRMASPPGSGTRCGCGSTCRPCSCSSRALDEVVGEIHESASIRTC